MTVLQAVAQDAGWQRPKPAARHPDAALGRGLALARYKNTGAYCALVVQVEVTERIVLDRVWAAVGLRARHLPLTPERLLDLMQQ